MALEFTLALDCQDMSPNSPVPCWVLRRPVFIHELQVEPWGPKAIWEMTTPQQNQSMSPERIAFNINFAQSCHATPIDLWGGEWWYWRYQNGDKTIWQAVKDSLKD